MEFKCDNCHILSRMKPSRFIKTKYHFCSRKCYSKYRRDHLPPEEQNAWKGGIPIEESRKRWYEKNKEKSAAQAKARRQRELDAPGHHTKAEWESIKTKYNNQCADKDDTCNGPITKDHIVPLIMGGSNNPENLQPLCRSHNTRKWKRVYTGNFTV